MAPTRVLTGAAWAAFIGYAALVAPKSAPEVDAALVTQLITLPFSGAANYLFEAQFNALGVMPAVYASLLMPGSKGQKPVPTVPFVAGSFALGYFSIGPYLTLREFREEPVKRSELGWFTRNVLEAKWNAALLTAFASYLAFSAATHASAQQLAEYGTLFDTVSLVNVSACDLIVLSAAVFLPMREDMKRRGWEDRSAAAVAFCALPVLGPALYLLLRPSLEE